MVCENVVCDVNSAGHKAPILTRFVELYFTVDTITASGVELSGQIKCSSSFPYRVTETHVETFYGCTGG